MRRAETYFPVGALLRDHGNPAVLDSRVLDCVGDCLIVSAGGQSHRYNRKETNLRRWLLPPHTAVVIGQDGQSQNPRQGLVVGFHGELKEGEPWSYTVNTEAGLEVVSEEQLSVLKVDFEDPVARLEFNGWRGPRRFYARLRLLERTTVWKQDSEGIPAFLGARIEPLFHQFYAARRCLMDRETRFLLADEVGLGKTIEAGLVIQSLTASKPNMRILVVAPGTTSRQWLSELYWRFGGRVFTHVDLVRYTPRPGARKEMQALLASDHLIITTSMLRSYPRALATVADQKWDLLVVDEGHNLANWPDLVGPLRRVSEAASGCLVLTATPGRGDDRGLFEMLKLVAPATYGNVTLAEFVERLGPQREITERLLFSEELVAALLEQGEIEEEDARDLAAQWAGIFPNDPVVEERLYRMEEGDGQAAEELVAHIQEHYRVDRRIIRTRRRTLAEYGSHFASRSLEVLEYEPSPTEVAVSEQVEELLGRSDVPSTWKTFWSRHVCTTPLLMGHLIKSRLAAVSETNSKDFAIDPLADDLGPAEEEDALRNLLSSGPVFPGEKLWLEQTASQVDRWCWAEERAPSRFMALRSWLDRSSSSGSRKTLVFSQSRQVVEELAKYLRWELGQNSVEVMTHNLRDDEIAEVARRFERSSDCLVLLSDEVGAEGRNFQFADAVVHLDQPALVARIEQRIGRLDRIGRAMLRPVASVVFIGPFDLERAYLELHRDLFCVYERSIGGLEYLLPRFQQRIRTAGTEGAKALRELAQVLHPELAAEERRVDEAFSFFLDTTRPELERAKELANLVSDRTGDEDESYIRDWCKELRIELRPQEGDLVKVEVRAERLDSPISALGPRDWIKEGTFLRSTALELSGVQYLAPGHLFVDALLQSAETVQDARSAAFFRDLGMAGRGRAFCIVVGRLGPDEAALTGGLPAGLMRRAEHYLPVEWVRSVFEISPDGDVSSVPSGPLLEQLRQDFLPSDRKCYPDHLWQMVERFPGLWDGLRVAVGAAKRVALKERQDLVEAAASELEDTLRSELAYLRSQETGDGTAETTRALCEREALLASVRSPSVATDAVALVFGNEGR